MKPTIYDIINLYEKYNKLIFNNQLPRPTLLLSDRKRGVGLTKCKTMVNPDGKKRNYDFSISISTYWDLPEEEYIDTLVHEMIHYYIAYHNIEDNAMHGKVFMKMMNEITLKHGIKISVNFTPTEEIISSGKGRERLHYICVAEGEKEDHYLIVAAKNKLSDLQEQIPKIPGLKNIKWYTTKDPFFDEQPIAVSPSMREIDRELLNRHLKSANIIENQEDLKKRIDELLRTNSYYQYFKTNNN